MRGYRRWLLIVTPLLLLAVLGFAMFVPRPEPAGQFPDDIVSGLEWRNVGPWRAGRTYAVAGNANQPDTFYMGSAGGGAWKTINAGRTWDPIGEKEIAVGSIGAIAVAPSNPNIVYIGTGEPDIRGQHSYGDGMYKSTDGAKTFTPIGLVDSRQIGKIAVDPANPNLVYVAALGHAYDANPMRGVYRSTDGGVNWTKVLYDKARPNDVGAIDIVIDPSNSKVIYASLWGTRRPPWSVYAPSNLPGGGLFKSTDGGTNWTKLAGGLPTDDFVGKIGIAIAPSNPKRLWVSLDDVGGAFPIVAARGAGGGGAAAAGAAGATPAPAAGAAAAPAARGGRGARGAAAPTGGGIYVSDDAGATWRLVNSEKRLWDRGWYFEQLAVDPVNPDKAYVINTATFVTTDGGKTFTPLKGSPGGDDYHQLWVNPKDGNRMVLSSDQGTLVSVDDGKTWSSWYNQSTAQVYHVAADNRTPYWLYGPQQDSGAAAAATRGIEGIITFRDWLPACAGGESNTVIPDPDNASILYSRTGSCVMGGGGGRGAGGGGGGGGRGGGAAPDPNDPARKTWTLPTVFSTADNALYTSDQFLLRSRDRGRTWETISPDLTRLNPPVPANLDPATAKDIDEAMIGVGANHDENRYGVIYTIGPSPISAQTVWIGTDDGYIQVTRDDGKNWTNVTPPAMTAWSKVSQVEAGHFDVNTAYASVDRHRLADMKAYIYRTHDGGKTWQNAANGIPDGAFVNSVKEDPVRKGLLYAATELRMYVSFDDGDHWQSLQTNMPPVSVRDVIVHNGDLAIATFGRGFWVLDNMAPLRELAEKGQSVASGSAYLFKPADSMIGGGGGGGGGGTPLPKDEPQLPAPPTGVIAYYYLRTPPTTPVKLELLTPEGTVQSCAASDQPVNPPNTETLAVQAIWQMPAPPPSAAVGMHRWSFGGGGGRGGGGGGRGGGGGAAVTDACSAPAVPAANIATPAPAAAAAGGRGGRGAGRGGRGGGGGGAAGTGDFTVRLTVNGQVYTQTATIKAASAGEAAGTAGGGQR